MNIILVRPEVRHRRHHVNAILNEIGCQMKYLRHAPELQHDFITNLNQLKDALVAHVCLIDCLHSLDFHRLNDKIKLATDEIRAFLNEYRPYKRCAFAV